METAAFDYELPSGRIAQVPIEPRDAARLLVDGGPGADPEHRHVRDLPSLLDPGDLVVVNDTRVLPARLALRRTTGGAAEVLLLERRGPDPADGWLALVRPSRKLAPGTRLVPTATVGDGGRPMGAGDTTARPGTDDGSLDIVVEVLDDLGEGRRVVRIVPARSLDRDATPGAAWDRATELAAIGAIGAMPLPPYITEPLGDAERYQTVYAREPGSAAAPTAGLHLTTDLLGRLAASGVRVVPLELQVGLDTFRPITVDQVEDHRMHTERYRVPEATWDAVGATRAVGGRVVVVGTTALRALESAASRGELEGRTDLFIVGDHEFGVVDLLLTNFHLPRSSLLVLIDALVGPRWRRLYAAALADDYRFLSFGDAMLLRRGRGV